MVTALVVPPPSVVVLSPPTMPPGPVVRRAADLASAYDRNVAACWRGETTGRQFSAWLESFWRPTVLVPVGPPTAVSVHGGGGRGIAWYEAGPLVVGCMPRRAGGYWVPRGVPLVGEAR
jgi:hypothetical protein